MRLSVDLSSSLDSDDRFQRLVDIVTEALPVDAVTVLSLDDDLLTPVAQHGLSDDAMGRSFLISQHPRLARICEAGKPVVFEPDCEMPDPFDGLLAAAPNLNEHIHACAGCPLWVHERLTGVLTLDALKPDAFAKMSRPFLDALGALTGATLHTSLLMQALEQSAKRSGLIAQNLMQSDRARHGSYLIGSGDVMKQLKDEIRMVGGSQLPVLITGETGSGKELAVQMLHKSSQRADRTLVYVNCAALPETVAESELFGHAAGAFTDAKNTRLGKFQIADGATLFLDEIGELPLSVQAKLLRVLQFGEIQRMGSDDLSRVDVRVFAATNRDLNEEVKAGRFRADLLHRLDVCRLHVPALHEHADDIPAIAGHFCDTARLQLGSGRIHLTPQAREALQEYSWPGNVRELENVISRATLRAAARGKRGAPILLSARDLGEDFSVARQANQNAGVQLAAPLEAEGVAANLETQTMTENLVLGDLKELTTNFQIQLIQRAISKQAGNRSAAARELGMHRSNLHRLMQRLEM
ncbi:MAG: nitric oxide reductase transcriptional regulator NorR [Planctomycetes bacterium]|nr:nitric oxide reductase transcriptional regulator NorR [Planctomycetota bacterium]